jgi:hypothetical protein
MQTYETMTQESVAERLLQADIRRTNSEMLLFITIFGNAKLKQLAKAELSKRACCHEDQIDYGGVNRELNIVANC